MLHREYLSVGKKIHTRAEEPSRDCDVPVMRSKPEPACYACGSPGAPRYPELSDQLFSAKGKWSLSKCASENCGLLWLDPMPLEEDLRLAYQDYYTHWDTMRPAPVRALRFLYRMVTGAGLMLIGIPIERRKIQRMLLDTMHVGSLLDVGCGSGAFLAMMKKRGWSVMGVDVDPAAIAVARNTHGLDVHEGNVATLLARNMTFDVITASHVIEHIPDPVGFLTQCRELLRPGGRIVLRTPNGHSFGLRRYGSAWRDLDPPRHLHIFTTSALENCAQKAGLRISTCLTSSAIAESTLVASRFIARRGRFRHAELTSFERMEMWLVQPFLALRAKIAWFRDRQSGEEICAVLTR